MPAITLTITNAGRAALVDAANAGTFAIRIASAGLTASAFTPLATATTLPGEFSRIAGISGAAVDPDTISMVIRDDSSAVYTLRGLGLFLADGTLFAIYSQPTPILEKAANSTALIVLDVRFADINATNITFGDANFLSPPATTTIQGVVELATDGEAIAATDNSRAIVPTALKAVLDARFGLGAATAFVRTLLTAASAAAFRVLLEIKSAALKDEGAGGTLDADLLDGQHGSFYANIPARLGFTPYNITNPAGYISGISSAMVTTALGYTPWHINNDGAGSGLDADLLDGQQGSFYANIPARLGYTPANRAGDSFTGRLLVQGNGIGPNSIATSAGGGGEIEVISTGGGAAVIGFHRPFAQFAYFGLDTDNRFKVGGASFGANAYVLWHTGNDGAGSGLDADLLDGRDSTSFANASHTHTAADLAGAFAAQNLSDDGWQELPGGLLLQWGRNRTALTGENSVAFAFPRAFTGAPFVVQLTGVNPAGANNRDMYPQLQYSDSGGAIARIQQPDSGNARPFDGFDWFAVGRAGTGVGAVPGGGGGSGGGGGGGGGGSEL